MPYEMVQTVLVNIKCRTAAISTIRIGKSVTDKHNLAIA